MAGGREHIVETAYELFSRHGTRAVGVDRIIAEAGTAKMTLYRNFATKDELIVAFLERREKLWTHGWLQAEIEHRASAPRDLRSLLSELAAAAGAVDPDAFARQWHILMKGSIVAAGEGDRRAADRARELGALLLQARGL